MAKSASLTSISIQLQQLLHAINTRLLAAAAAPDAVEPHEIATSRLVLELENWGRQIDLYLKRLRQIQGNLDVRASQIRSVPRDQRFRERQSIGGRQDAHDRTLAIALEAKARLKDLFMKTILPGDVELTNKAFDQIDDTIKEFKELSEAIDKAQLAKKLSQSEAVTMKSVISKDMAVVQNPATQMPIADPLLTLSLVARLFVLYLKSRNKDN